ncbi:MAG: peptidylprolyl isomerase [Fimbriimonadales bacterium]
MITLLAMAMLAPQAAYVPTGPIIEVRIEGRGKFEITTDTKNSPKTVAHIKELVEKKFYNRQRIHRVESWVTQWGAPASKNADLTDSKVLGGGSGKSIPFEKADVDFTRGVVGIASSGLQVGGDSQIFILKADTLRLYSSYAVLGKVTKGMDVVDAIKKGDRITKMLMKKP